MSIIKEENKEIEKISDEELKQIQEITIVNQQLMIKFGQIEFQLQYYLLEKQKLIDVLEHNKNIEVSLHGKLKEKYKDVIINTETGEITSQT